MKCFAVLAALALAAASTHAAECTSESMSAINGKSEYTKFESACGSLILSGASITSTSDMAAAQKKMCADTTCLSALEAAIKVFPDCTVSGVSLKKPLEDQMALFKTECKKITSAAPAMASGLSATAAATVAAVAVFAQL